MVMQSGADLGTVFSVISGLTAILINIVTITMVFAYTKKQVEQNAKDIAKMSAEIDRIDTTVTTHVEMFKNILHNMEVVTLKQTEQDKAYLEIKQTLVKIETSLEYIKTMLPKQTYGTRASDHDGEIYSRRGSE